MALRTERLLDTIEPGALCVCGHPASAHGQLLPAHCNVGHDVAAYCAAINAAIDAGRCPLDAFDAVQNPDGCRCSGFRPAGRCRHCLGLLSNILEKAMGVCDPCEIQKRGLTREGERDAA